MTPAKPPRDASTVIVVRDATAHPEIYMVRRHHGHQFMANAHVFPGGRLDEADCGHAIAARCRGVADAALTARLGIDDPSLARGLYVAGLREAFEESGVLVATDADGAPLCDVDDALDAQRAQLNAGTITFDAALAAVDAYLPLDRLRYLERWVTPEFEPKRYDARFFICRVPDDQRASHDTRESTAGAWMTADALLAANADRTLHLAPPTLCILDRLREASSAEAMVALAPNAPSAPISPRPLAQGADGLTLLMPGDHRFDDQASAGGPQDYVVLRDGNWAHVRSD